MPSFAWPVHAGTNVPESFLVEIQRLYGAVPVLAYAYGDPSFGNWTAASITKLAERGIRDVTLRLVQPKGRLRDVRAMVDLYSANVEEWLKQGIEPDLQVLNEPDIEHTEHGVAEVVEYQLAANYWFRVRFGGQLRLLSFPLAQDAHRTPAWVAAMDPLFSDPHACDGIGWHHYVIRPGDLAENAIGSPAWLYQHKPGWFAGGRALWLTEFGVLTAFEDPAAPRWSDEQRLEILRVLVSRYVGLSYVAKMFYFVPLAEGQEHSQHFVDTEAERRFFEWACDEWRRHRHWPRGAAPTAPPVVSDCGVNHADLTNVMHAYWQTYQGVLAERDRAYAELTRRATEMFDQIVAYKRIAGVE